ncbi:sucrose operon repressor [Vibrio tubiashii]|nr:sucrose operon repressor [Vibrio tubiashii]
MATKKLKLADIAELAGVSKSTVSFVLNGHAKKHRIHEETVKKVQAIAFANNYSPSIYARALKSKQTYTAGLVIPDLTNMGFATIAKRLEILCRSEGYQLLIASSDDDPEMENQAIRSLVDRQVDLLLIATAQTDESELLAATQSTPVILFDRVIDGSKAINIKTDAASATQEVVAKLAYGLDECFYIGGQMALSPSKDRFSGYKAGLKQAGVEFQPKHVFNQDYQPSSGYEMMARAIEQNGRLPQAVFTASYSLLEGVLRYLTEHSLLMSDIRIATFDNYDILDSLPIKVDSIEQDCDLIAQALFDAGKAVLSQPDSKVEQQVFPAKIHYRR